MLDKEPPSDSFACVEPVPPPESLEKEAGEPLDDKCFEVGELLADR